MAIPLKMTHEDAHRKYGLSLTNQEAVARVVALHNTLVNECDRLRRIADKAVDDNQLLVFEIAELKNKLKELSNENTKEV